MNTKEQKDRRRSLGFYVIISCLDFGENVYKWTRDMAQLLGF